MSQDHFIVNSRPGYRGDSCAGVWREPYSAEASVFSNFLKIAVEEPSPRLPLEDAGSGKWAADFAAVRNMHSAPYPSFFHDGVHRGGQPSWATPDESPWVQPQQSNRRDLLVSYIGGDHGFPVAVRTRSKLRTQCMAASDCVFLDAVGMRDVQSGQFMEQVCNTNG